MSVTFSTQLTAIATLALAVLALAAAVLAGLAYLKQSREVGLLLEQNKRDTGERRRAQAARVFLVVRPGHGAPINPYAQNASDLPISEVRIWHPGSEGGPPEYQDFGVIMPGDTAQSTHEPPAGQDLEYVALTFRDAAGFPWLRWPDGSLMEHYSPSLSDRDLAAHDIERATRPIIDRIQEYAAKRRR